MAVICPVWYAATYVGVIAGAAIPPQYALDFAVPITFIALVAPSLRSLPHLAAAFVSVVVSLTLSWMPYNAWLMIAAVLAMMTGATLEAYLLRRVNRASGVGASGVQTSPKQPKVRP
ncbi:MAG: hypothetical protein DSY85_15680 [Marinomonas sp.]|nr:MAG: hypothetical protein DSY85_15680 [Marinomonas sp.]